MITCKICIFKKGFRLSNTDRIFETDEQLAEHIENVHGTPVVREGETEEQAAARCAMKGIVPDRAKCKCNECVEDRKKRMKTQKIAFSVMADGRNELYILAESAEAAEMEYVGRMKEKVKATPLDTILEFPDYRDVLKDLERCKKELDGEIVKGYKFFIKGYRTLPIEHNEHEYLFKVGGWSVEGSENTSIRCFDTAENAVASFERRLERIVESGREEICLNIWKAVLFECDCERSEKESVRMWSNCEWWEEQIGSFPKGTIICDSVRVVKEVEISGKVLEYKKILEDRGKSRPPKPAKAADYPWL